MDSGILMIQDSILVCSPDPRTLHTAAKTIHTFQGQTVGPAAPGRPENPITRILDNPGDQTFEGNNIGLFYTAVSQTTTIGSPNENLAVSNLGRRISTDLVI
jgi:hypothetical protein